MDWTYPPGSGPEGIFEIGHRLTQHLGRIPDATTFTNDAREMLRITRRVEAVARGGHLLVGFQNAAKLDAERERYLQLIADGTRIVAFGSGRPADPFEGMEWREQKPARRPLGNQWFLVSDAPERVGFVSWEISDPELFGSGGAATPGKRFVGFITDDPLVVSELVGVLSGVVGIDRTPPSAPPAIERDGRTQALADAVRAMDPPTSGAEAGAVIVPLRSEDDGHAERLGMAVALAEGRALVLVDRSAESIFGSPYADLRGDDEYRPRPDRLFDPATAMREGRSGTARAIAAARLLGIEAGGWFPVSSGADGVREAIERFGGSVIVVPAATRHPSVGERIRGMTLQSLERLGVPVLVAD